MADTPTGSTSSFEKLSEIVVDELKSKFGTSIPVTVLSLLLPHILNLNAVKEADVDLRLAVQSRIDDTLRRLGLI